MTTHTERRQYPRIEYRREIVAYAATQRLRLQACDLGAGGIGLVPLHAEQTALLSQATMLRLNLPLAPHQTTTVDGLIIRRPPKGCYGVSFVRVPTTIRRQLEAFVAEQLEELRAADERNQARLHRASGGIARERDTPQTLADHEDRPPRQERETYGRRRAHPTPDRRAERSTPKVERPRRVTPPTRKVLGGESGDDGFGAPDSLEALRRRWSDDADDER